jgi:hypothetical protein
LVLALWAGLRSSEEASTSFAICGVSQPSGRDDCGVSSFFFLTVELRLPSSSIKRNYTCFEKSAEKKRGERNRKFKQARHESEHSMLGYEGVNGIQQLVW